MERQGYLPAAGAGAAMLYTYGLDVGERLIRIPARCCATDKGAMAACEMSERLSGSQTS
jgi:hypothetical protein